MPLLAAPAAMTIIANVGVCLWTGLGAATLLDKGIGITMRRRAARAARKSNPGLATA